MIDIRAYRASVGLEKLPVLNLGAETWRRTARRHRGAFPERRIVQALEPTAMQEDYGGVWPRCSPGAHRCLSAVQAP